MGKQISPYQLTLEEYASTTKVQNALLIQSRGSDQLHARDSDLNPLFIIGILNGDTFSGDEECRSIKSAIAYATAQKLFPIVVISGKSHTKTIENPADLHWSLI